MNVLFGLLFHLLGTVLLSSWALIMMCVLSCGLAWHRLRFTEPVVSDIVQLLSAKQVEKFAVSQSGTQHLDAFVLLLCMDNHMDVRPGLVLVHSEVVTDCSNESGAQCVLGACRMCQYNVRFLKYYSTSML